MNSLTDWFILALIAVVSVFDIYLLLAKKSTISKRMRKHGTQISALPYSWGVLGGHFWGPDLNPLNNSWLISILTLVGAGAVLAGLNYLLSRLLYMPKWVLLLYLIAGIPAGVFLWPQ